MVHPNLGWSNVSCHPSYTHLTGPCFRCGVVFDVGPVLQDAIQRHIEGEIAQTAFPDLSKGEREFLISMTCSGCWAKIFGTTPEFEEPEYPDCTHEIPNPDCGFCYAKLEGNNGVEDPA